MSDAAPIPPSPPTLDGTTVLVPVLRRARFWFRVMLAVLVLWFGVLAGLWYTTVFRNRPAAVTPATSPMTTQDPAPLTPRP